MKEKLFQIFFCFYIFWDVTMASYLGIRGLELDGSAMRLTLIVIAVLSWFFFFLYKPLTRKEKRGVFFIFLFGVLFWSTHFFYDKTSGNYSGYNGQMLRWASDCVSGFLIGNILMKQKDYSTIHRYLPWFIVLLTPYLAISTILLAATQSQMVVDGGMTYQMVAYVLAVLFCFSLFYVFIDNNPKSWFLKLLILVCMLIQAVCCAMSGGRGGLVLLGLYIVYMAYYIIKNHVISNKKLISTTFIAIIGFFVIASKFNLWNAAGYLRSSNSLDDDDRLSLWAQHLPYVEDNWLVGAGLGGDYFTIGFYSHNILIDLLIEVGIIGTIIVISIYYKTYKRIYTASKKNHIFILILILFIYAILTNCFSGYWISMNVNWLAFGVAISIPNYYLYNKNNI